MDAGHYVRHASRALRARPGLTLVCIAIIALGSGASTAVASAVHALLIRPLPLPRADRLVTGFALREGFDPPNDGVTYACAAALVAIISTFAAWAPAMRAANVDPASLLR
jgi:ABC-type antimicrobial peptide transport system permease subunit